MPTLNRHGWRTGALARRAGYSAQQIRNLERDGVLPPADRTDAGYRSYREVHLQSAQAYRALAAGIGPVAAKALLRAVHSRPVHEVLARLDAAHAGLDRERSEVRLARAAVAAIADEPIRDVRPSDAMSVSELATALGVRASTLRHWDAEGLAVPDRVTPGGARRYAPNQVRDARIVQQLRLAGYRIDTLRAVLPELTGHGKAEVTAALAARDVSIETRSRALLDAAAMISRLLADRDARARL
ncbi:MerR family transcriptional regulator [Microlunatus parietis]|uniref:DNA-binding transcriptional MerR regulator n=1 Tax=Microlunatus parietis TaxID=682979 RepID=A0A7Y9LB20_9ACTN|nr:MerR family transcriptional regulator [Microlunatus parietis]NYE73424.1 DNA-binding transcriptional MerR regulator [Microlunatus parietis]